MFWNVLKFWTKRRRLSGKVLPLASLLESVASDSHVHTFFLVQSLGFVLRKFRTGPKKLCHTLCNFNAATKPNGSNLKHRIIKAPKICYFFLQRTWDKFLSFLFDGFMRSFCFNWNQINNKSALYDAVTDFFASVSCFLFFFSYKRSCRLCSEGSSIVVISIFLCLVAALALALPAPPLSVDSHCINKCVSN